MKIKITHQRHVRYFPEPKTHVFLHMSRAKEIKSPRRRLKTFRILL